MERRYVRPEVRSHGPGRSISGHAATFGAVPDERDDGAKCADPVELNDSVVRRRSIPLAWIAKSGSFLR